SFELGDSDAQPEAARAPREELAVPRALDDAAAGREHAGFSAREDGVERALLEIAEGGLADAREDRSRRKGRRGSLVRRQRRRGDPLFRRRRGRGGASRERARDLVVEV